MSTQVSTTKRERTRSKGAICFEYRKDGEDTRVRIAQDTDPAFNDAITTSDPDARDYADELPAHPLPGSGETGDDCGIDVHGLFCPDCGSPQLVGRTCRRSRCSRCWQSWAFHRGTTIAAKLESLATGMDGHTKKHHLTVSFRDSTRFNSKDSLDRAIAVQKQLMSAVNVDTGYIIYHPYRIAPEYRGSVMGHESGSGDMTWKDILEKLESDEWSWEAVKDEFLTYSPHFHVLALSPMVQTGAVAERIEDETGVVIHRITQERKDGNEKSIVDLNELSKVTAYSLSHAGLAPKNDGERHRAAVRPFGEVANFEAFENIKADTTDVMRRVAGTVLGVDFSKPECNEQVPDDGDDGDDGDHAAVRSLGVPTSSGSGMSSDGFGGSGSGSGSSDAGFAAALAADSTESWDASEGSVPSTMSSPDDRNLSACDGTLVPMWTAESYFTDPDWIREIGNRFGRERISELREAYDEWEAMGRPQPRVPGDE